MNADIVIIGDEILLGIIHDTNSVFLSRRLTEFGITVRRITKVGDSTDAIAAALESACKQSDLVICCGGLGPTHDDKTRHAIAQLLETPLECDDRALIEILDMYRRINRPMSESNRIQAMIPKGTVYLSNPVGTAPGIRFKHDKAEAFALQGIPREMEALFDLHVVPWIRDWNLTAVTMFRTIRTANVPESVLYEKTKDLIDEYNDLFDVAFLPKITRGVDIRLTMKERPSATDVFEEPMIRWQDRINAEFHNAVYGLDDERMEDAAARLLFETRKTIAVAESCTGGLLANRLTNVPGSSRYFMYGAVTYSNESKTALCGVPEELIRRHGAVSAEVAVAMAEGIRKYAGTDIGISVTGIAGPDGGTDEKPVGLVYIGLSAGEKTAIHQPFNLLVPLDRLSFKKRTTQFALDVLRKYLLSFPITYGHEAQGFSYCERPNMRPVK